MFRITWKPFFYAGWYSNNPIIGFQFEIFNIIGKWPQGWLAIVLVGLHIGKFEASIGIEKA